MKPTQPRLVYVEWQGEIHSFADAEARRAWVAKREDEREWAETEQGWRLMPASPQYLGSAYPQVKQAEAYKRVIHHPRIEPGPPIHP